MMTMMEYYNLNAMESKTIPEVLNLPVKFKTITKTFQPTY